MYGDDLITSIGFVKYTWVLMCETLWGTESWALEGGGVLAGQGQGCWLTFCIERKHTVCSASVKYVRCLLIPSSDSMTYSVVLLCETVVDLHDRQVTC